MRLELGVNLLHHDIDIYLRSSFEEQPSRVILAANSHLVANYEATVPVVDSADRNSISLIEFTDSANNWPMLDVTMFHMRMNSSLESATGISDEGVFLFNFALMNINVQNSTSTNSSDLQLYSNSTISLELINSIDQVYPNLPDATFQVITHAIQMVSNITYDSSNY